MLNSTLLQTSTKLLIKYHCTRWMEWRAVRDHAPLCLNVSLTFPKATKRQDRQQEETFLFHSRKMTSGYSGASASSNATNAYHHFQFSLFFLLISSCANHWLTDDKNNSWRYGFMYGIFEYWKTKKHERDPSDLLSTNMWQIIVVTLGCWWLTAERSTGPFTYHTHTHTRWCWAVIIQNRTKRKIWKDGFYWSSLPTYYPQALLINQLFQCIIRN